MGTFCEEFRAEEGFTRLKLSLYVLPATKVWPAATVRVILPFGPSHAPWPPNRVAAPDESLSDTVTVPLAVAEPCKPRIVTVEEPAFVRSMFATMVTVIVLVAAGYGVLCPI
jgi:hypothetical protein